MVTIVGCQTKVPIFNKEKAFNHLVAQCDFGPRNPGSEGHIKTLGYLLETLTPLADTVFTQSYIEIMPRTRKKVNMNNICLLYTSPSPRD